MHAETFIGSTKVTSTTYSQKWRILKTAAGTLETRNFMQTGHEETSEDLERFSKLLETFSKRENDPGNSNIFSQDSVINSIGEFVYKPDEEVTFGKYFRRCEEIFQKDCETWSDGKKVQLLLGKFSDVEHEKYANFILPRHSREISFLKLIQILTKIFRERCLLFNTRRQFLNLTKKENEDYSTFARIVNRECEKFRLSQITPNMFKCLIFVQGLTAPTDAEIRSILLTKLEQNQKIILQNLVDKC